MGSRITLSQRLNTAAGTDARRYFGPSNDETWKLIGLTVIPNATSAANDTNYASIRAYKGASTAVMAARVTTTAGGALTQGTAEDLTLTGVGADLEITKAAPLSIRDDQSNGSGVITDYTITAEFERMGAF